jgi:hypothetical protein
VEIRCSTEIVQERLEQFTVLSSHGKEKDVGHVFHFPFSFSSVFIYFSNLCSFATFCFSLSSAMCDVYYGDNAVSPAHKDDVIKGILNL